MSDARGRVGSHPVQVVRRWRHALLALAGAILATSASAAPIEYQTTANWWGKHGKATEGNPTVGFALPVLNGAKTMIGSLSLVCPRQSERGAFLQVPMTVYPDQVLQGKRVMTILGVNGYAFSGYVDNDRFLVYLNAPAPPPLPGMKPGKSVRAALLEGKGVMNITTDPARPSGITVKAAPLEQTLPALVASAQRSWRSARDLRRLHEGRQLRKAIFGQHPCRRADA
jgi:hypothetical protein